MTWSILARDAGRGEVSGALPARFFAAGAFRLRAGGRIGASAIQALVNPMSAPAAFGHLRAGAAPEVAVRAIVDADPGRRAGRLRALGANGASFRHTGEDCVEWAAHAEGEPRRPHGVARTRFARFRRFLARRDHPGVFDRAVINAAIARMTAGASVAA